MRALAMLVAAGIFRSADSGRTEYTLAEEGAMADKTHHAPEFRHPDDMDWEMGRFRNVTKFLFHPTPERPTVPNVGFLRYEPGAGFPLHKHDFAQIWYVIDGVFKMGERTYGPGTIVYME